MKPVVVTGGAGYIGSHIVRRLRQQGRRVVVIDDLSEGHRAAVGDAELVQADFGDRAVLDRVFGAEPVACVVHMAASCLVGDSMSEPAAYYANNLLRGLALVDAMRAHGVERMVFSSTAAVYGEPKGLPIEEDHDTRPTNPYGETKLAFERALAWYGKAYGFRFAVFRYFNAAGAHPDGDLGEDHRPESHLIPRVLSSVLQGGPAVPIFGEDYPTADGTCVRDYVHVVDLAEAHVLALEGLEGGSVRAEAFNLGNGEGFSVRQVLEAVTRVTGEKPAAETAPRRPGDPAVLVASSGRARRVLGWAPAFPALDDIVRTAWAWHRAHPDGYGRTG